MRLNRTTDNEIQRYLDGTVSPEERERIERTLHEGQDNARLLDDYSMLYNQLSRCEAAPLSPSFTDRVMDRIASVVPAQPSPYYAVHPAILLALLAGASIIVYFLNPINIVSILGSLSLPDGWGLPDVTTVLVFIEVLQVKIAGLGSVVPYLGVSAAAMVCITLFEHMLLEPQLKRI